MHMHETQPEDLAMLEAYVLDQLAGGMRPQAVMFEVAKRQGWPWHQAEAFVYEVGQRQKELIRKRQSPLFRVMSGLLMVAGGVLLASMLLTLAEYWQALRLQRSDLRFLALLLSVLGMVVVGELPKLMWGVALLLAGIIGWWKTLPPRVPPEFDYGSASDDEG